MTPMVTARGEGAMTYFTNNTSPFERSDAQQKPTYGKRVFGAAAGATAAMATQLWTGLFRPVSS